jgi:hypothetical protein
MDRRFGIGTDEGAQADSRKNCPANAVLKDVAGKA